MSPRYSYASIVKACAAETGHDVESVLGARMDGSLPLARHRAFYLARTLRDDLSLPQIGRMTGGRDHTTVLHGVRRVAALILDGASGELAALERIKARLALDAPEVVGTAAQLAALDIAIAEAERRLDAIRVARVQIAEAL